jgi:hypothetical protein
VIGASAAFLCIATALGLSLCAAAVSLALEHAAHAAATGVRRLAGRFL